MLWLSNALSQRDIPDKDVAKCVALFSEQHVFTQERYADITHDDLTVLFRRHRFPLGVQSGLRALLQSVSPDFSTLATSVTCSTKKRLEATEGGATGAKKKALGAVTKLVKKRESSPRVTADTLLNHSIASGLVVNAVTVNKHGFEVKVGVDHTANGEVEGLKKMGREDMKQERVENENQNKQDNRRPLSELRPPRNALEMQIWITHFLVKASWKGGRRGEFNVSREREREAVIIISIGVKITSK
jgi:hypothetical protein